MKHTEYSVNNDYQLIHKEVGGKEQVKYCPYFSGGVYSRTICGVDCALFEIHYYENGTPYEVMLNCQKLTFKLETKK